MDQELVIRARAGDHGAFSELAAGRLGRLNALARLILMDHAAAQDAVQDALVDAWRDLPTLRDTDRFDAWLRTLLVRSCRDQVRKRQRRTVREVALSPLHGGSLSDTQHAVADRDHLDRALRRVPADQRAVLALVYHLDLPLSEVAMALGIPVGTTKSRLNRALTSLRAAIDADARAEGIAEARTA